MRIRGIVVAAGAAALAALLVWPVWRVVRSGHWRKVFAERIPVHRQYWEGVADRLGALRYVAVGDSSAQGIGALHPSGSYVGKLAELLSERFGVSVRVVNLSRSGARLRDIIEVELPRLDALARDGLLDDALVTLAAGANDIAEFDAGRFRAELATILDALPRHALVAEVPAFYVDPYESRVRVANRLIRELAAQRGLTVVPLHRATSRFWLAGFAARSAADLFHPNDRGYRAWARAFLPDAIARVAGLSAPG